MNLPTTIEEIELLFRNHWGERDKTANADLKPLFQLASKSELIKGCAIGATQAVMQGYSLGGVTTAPALSLILAGFRLGALWASPLEPISEPISEARTAYQKWLEENPVPKGVDDGRTPKD